jgi:hypothetical protein
MTPTSRQMEKLKHATGFDRCLIQFNLTPGWRTYWNGHDAECEEMCEAGWMKRYGADGYNVTARGLELVLAEWDKVKRFDVVVVTDSDYDGTKERDTTRVVAKTHAAARFKVANSIQDAWSCSFIEAVRHIKSVRKVR